MLAWATNKIRAQNAINDLAQMLLTYVLLIAELEKKFKGKVLSFLF
jgi:hypothetical protein